MWINSTFLLKGNWETSPHTGNHYRVSYAPDRVAYLNPCRRAFSYEQRTNYDLLVSEKSATNYCYLQDWDRSHVGKTKEGKTLEKFLGPKDYDEHFLLPFENFLSKSFCECHDPTNKHELTAFSPWHQQRRTVHHKASVMRPKKWAKISWATLKMRKSLRPLIAREKVSYLSILKTEWRILKRTRRYWQCYFCSMSIQ